MASKESIAITRDKAVATLREKGQQIAERLNINPPDFSFFYRDKDLHQAEELKALAAFLDRVQTALEGTSDDIPQTKKSASRRNG